MGPLKYVIIYTHRYIIFSMDKNMLLATIVIQSHGPVRIKMMCLKNFWSLCLFTSASSNSQSG